MPDKGHEAADKELKRLEKELTKHYKQAAEELTKKAEAFMRDFERKDAQMKKLVDAGKMTEQDYMNWRRNQAMTNERIQEMKDTLAKDLTHADQIAAGMIDATLPSAYAENFNFGTYEIETGTTIDTGFTLYDKKTVENLMKKDPDIIPQLTEKQKKKIPEDERWNRKKLTSAIAQGILQGESVPAIATRLQSVAIMDRNAAIRNARTYTTAAENKGRVDSIARANDMGIPADQEWIATLDDRTRMEHRHLDGQVRPVGEHFETDGYRILYPGDPHAEPEMIYNCRCTLVSKVKGRIYNDERNDSKLNGMSYEEWKHAKDRQMEPPKDVRLTDDLRDYSLPDAVKERLPEIMEMKTYADFDNYFSNIGIELDTGIDSLKGEKRNEEIPAVRDMGQKLVAATETYRSEFGDDAISSLEKIVLYDKEETSQAAYYYNMVGENDTKAGSIRFADWNADGREIFHEFGHAFQDSMKEDGEDACLFAKEIAEKISMDGLSEPKTRWDDYSYEAEKMADAFSRAYWTGGTADKEFVEDVQNYLENRKQEETQKEEPATIKTIGNTGKTFDEVYGDRPTRKGQISGVRRDGMEGWLIDNLGISDTDAEECLEAIEKYTMGKSYSAIHNNEKTEEKTIATLDAMLHNQDMPILKNTIYRGVHVDDSEGMTAEEKVAAIISGGTWNEPGITSFSSKKEKAEDFAIGWPRKYEGVNVLIVNNKNISGCPIQHLTTQIKEAEVLLPSDIKDRGFKIINSRTEERETPVYTKMGERLPDTFTKWIIIEVEENE